MVPYTLFHTLLWCTYPSQFFDNTQCALAALAVPSLLSCSDTCKQVSDYQTMRIDNIWSQINHTISALTNWWSVLCIHWIPVCVDMEQPVWAQQLRSNGIRERKLWKTPFPLSCGVPYSPFHKLYHLTNTYCMCTCEQVPCLLFRKVILLYWLTIGFP